MFGRTRKTQRSLGRAVAVGLEPLEGRQLLSGSPVGGHGGGHGFGGESAGGPIGGNNQQAIAFNLAPAAVQTGLDSLATADGLADPADTDLVTLGNRDGVETYSVTISSTGTVSKLTVDVAGQPVTSPTQSTTTFGALATAPAAEITAIATAKSLTAPASDTVVNVTTTAAGVVTYSVSLASDDTASPSTTDDRARPAIKTAIMIDAAGNPVGNQQLPFSVFSATVQDALNAGAPTGATALASDSTQSVSVRTADGVITYSAKFTVDGTDTTVTVDATGAAVTPASKTTADFSTIPTAAAAELQALAMAKGYTGTIADASTVTVYAEIGGTTVLYSITLSVADATDWTRSHDVTFVADASGNPTVLSMGQGAPGGPSAGGFGSGPGVGFGGDHGGGGDTHGGPGGFHGGAPDDGGDTSTTPPDSGATDETGATDDTGGATTTAAAATASAATPTSTPTSTPTPGGSHASQGGPSGLAGLAGLMGVDSPAIPTLGAALALVAPASPDAAVVADLAQLKTDAASLKAAVKALTRSDAATLKADTKAIATAVKALGATLKPAQKTLKTDTAKYAAVLKADQNAIRKDRKDATALAADQVQLETDQAAAFAALSADLDALKALISADAGVTAAQSKLATDLPTIASAQATVQSDYSQLELDIQAQLTA